MRVSGFSIVVALRLDLQNTTHGHKQGDNERPSRDARQWRVVKPSQRSASMFLFPLLRFGVVLIEVDGEEFWSHDGRFAGVAVMMDPRMVQLVSRKDDEFVYW